MDDRTSQIREGAGLDESRINQDFIDLLSKWSTPALFVIAAVVLAYWGYGQLQKRANAKVNRAFEEVANAVDYTVASPSPVTLRAIREQYGDIRGIEPMSALREADVYLNAAVRGVAPGAELQLDENNQSTGVYAEEDMLSDEDRQKFLDDAERLYREVAGMKGEAGWAIHRLGAQFGLAAVAESKGDAAGAKAAYAEAKTIAEAEGFELWSKIADERSATVDEMVVPVKLISKEALPKAPEPEIAAPTGTPEGEAPAPEGEATPETGETPVPPEEPSEDAPAEELPKEDPGAGDGSGG